MHGSAASQLSLQLFSVIPHTIKLPLYQAVELKYDRITNGSRAIRYLLNSTSGQPESDCCNIQWSIKINQVKWLSKRSRNFYSAHLIGYQNIYIIHMASYDESSLKAVYKSVELRY